MYGAAFDRQTDRYIPQAGLKVVETRFLFIDTIKLIVARPDSENGSSAISGER
jgi:hypothetical protein